jgi:hypothetical protein
MPWEIEEQGSYGVSTPLLGEGSSKAKTVLDETNAALNSTQRRNSINNLLRKRATHVICLTRLK